MTKLLESRMQFSVDSTQDIHIVKFDETTFFEKHYKKLQGSKGIDFLINELGKNEFFLKEDLQRHIGWLKIENIPDSH